jgi:hypothetical protein
MLWAAPTERSFKSEAATDTVTAIWGAAVVVIITDGVEAEGIITAGGIIATDFILLEAASVGGLSYFKPERNVACWQILLQKSFCVHQNKFFGPYARRSNNHLRDYMIL